MFRAAVDQAVTGVGGTVLVAGEAGTGKTTVVGECLPAERWGARSVGGCDDLLAPRTLGPLRDAACGTGGPLEQAL